MHTYRRNRINGNFDVGYVCAGAGGWGGEVFVSLFDTGGDEVTARQWVNYLNGGTGAAFMNSPIPHPLSTAPR